MDSRVDARKSRALSEMALFVALKIAAAEGVSVRKKLPVCLLGGNSPSASYCLGVIEPGMMIR